MFWECHDPTQKNSQGNDMELSIGQQFIIKMKTIKKLF